MSITNKVPSVMSRASTAIPWWEEAVVVRQLAAGEREQLKQGTLRQVIEWLAEQPDHDRLTIALPERRARPFGYNRQEIADLLALMDRPRSPLGFV